MRLSLAASLALLVTLSSLPARGYTREEVPDKPGVFMYWSNRLITYVVNKAGCADVPLSEAIGAIKRAFFTWASPSCTDLTFQYGGLEAAEKTNLTLAEKEQPDRKNLILWHENRWPPAGVTDPTVNNKMPAITTIIYNPESGAIIDADIDLNGFDFFWTTSDDPTKAATDIQNILTHEIGHVLGLGHSIDPAATMFSTTNQAELDKRSLEKDDLAGVCFIYPFSGDTPAGPGQGTIKTDVQGGCAMAPPRPGPSWALVLLALPLLGLLRRRRG